MPKKKKNILIFHFVFVSFFFRLYLQLYQTNHTMYIRAAVRSKLTTSLFSTTFLIAILTVAAPQLVGCPAKQPHLGADNKKAKDSQSPTMNKILEKQTDEQWAKKSVVIINRPDKSL